MEQDTKPVRRVYRRKTVQARLDGISTATLYRYMHKRGFPKPQKCGAGAQNIWDADEVDAWIAARLDTPRVT